MITPASIVVAIKDQLSCDLGDQGAVLSLKSNLYYELNAVGQRIWQLLQQPISLAEIRDTLVKEYQVGTAQCEEDLHRFLADMHAEGLLEVEEKPA
jgi:hypothetical protein